MKSNKKLVEHLIDCGVLKTQEIIEAFKNIDRKDFVPKKYLDAAYDDYPLPIGHGQTISQPFTVAFMLELLQPEKGDKILDIGSGSGWTTALLAFIVKDKGEVIGLERFPELVEFGQKNLSKYNFKNARIEEAETLGIPGEKFDKILVSASAASLPETLVDQLKTGGRMVIPILESIYKIDKISESEIEKEEHYGFAFVPLIVF
ncbi:protein-L-isoaspartate O-methyltransferase [Nitrosophilus alvini]|uniref:protein-L-isoaspartate O-methyltransferase n=1 Tax=Nitrosophilus alvini TaxID=2714855 RepID=UPI00190D1ED1|nr:protein-L-isoaspartate O-methyltransferase [Nitrosophilus alvini]